MKQKILIVDDDPNIVLAISTLLELHQYEVQSASNGLEGFQKFLDFEPQIVLVDIMMPKLNGHEMVKKIRNKDHDFLIKIIYLTAKGMEQDKREGYAKGADDFIVKPFANDDLLDALL